MKAVALDQFFANHQNAFWHFVEKLVHRHPAIAVRLEAEKKSKQDLFSGLKFFEDEEKFEDYVRDLYQ